MIKSNVLLLFQVFKKFTKMLKHLLNSRLHYAIIKSDVVKAFQEK